MDEETREKFLAKTRYGYVTTLRRDGSPVTVPVWFEWDGTAVRLFSDKDAAKVKRLQQDPRLTFLVASHLDEPEAWVAFDGPAVIEQQGGFELAERLAHRYWDMTRPEYQAVVEQWKAVGDSLWQIVLRPERIRTS